MKNHSVLNFLVFTCFLVVGYTFSIRFYQSGETIFSGSITRVTSENQNAIAAMDNGQRSILLINASSMDAMSQHLESIWLATYIPTDTTIQLLPIFPSGKETISSFEQQLDLTFSLSKVGGSLVLNQGFMDLLEENNYWWSGYIIFDEVSLENVIKLIGGIEINGKTPSEAQITHNLPGAPDDIHNAYSTQIGLLQSVCHNLFSISPSPDMSQLFTLVPDHIITDLDASQLQSELNALSSSPHDPICKFPTLEISRIEP